MPVHYCFQCVKPIFPQLAEGLEEFCNFFKLVRVDVVVNFSSDSFLPEQITFRENPQMF